MESHYGTLSNELAKTTLRIEVYLSDGVSTGTAFLYGTNLSRENGSYIPILITNRHVIEGGLKGKIIVTAESATGAVKHLSLELGNFEELWKPHPNPDIDLVAMPMGTILHGISKIGLVPRYRCLTANDILTAPELAQLGCVEDVLMAGYPNGLWDEVNNQPLFRGGITSTHPGIDFQGKKQFVVDIATFPGSSGSPVFLFNEGSYRASTGVMIASRMKLLGVLYAGPQFNVGGEIVVRNVPTRSIPGFSTAIPMNLGYVISSQVLMDFEPLFILPHGDHKNTCMLTVLDNNKE